MTVYIPSSVAAQLSSKLWDIARPASLRSEADTTSMFGTVGDWLEVDTEFSIMVHPLAELDIADILQPWIDNGHLPADTNTKLVALVQSMRGQRLVVYDAFPQLFKDMSKTYAQMVAAGLMVSVEP